MHMRRIPDYEAYRHAMPVHRVFSDIFMGIPDIIFFMVRISLWCALLRNGIHDVG